MTATTTCPNGHQSTTADYCDQCGTKLGATASPDPLIEAPVVAPTPSAAPGADSELCPTCGGARVGKDRFCEGCGYEFVARSTTPEAVARNTTPGTAEGAAAEGAAADGAAAEGAAAEGAGAEGGAAWEAVVRADPAYFDQVSSPGVTFPPHCPERSFSLAGAELRVGRRSASRGISPEIDLSGAPEDSAISHLHALLVRAPDGSYSVVDPGSTNGTTVNDDPTPIAPNTPVPLLDGDRIHLGAWTTITIRTRPNPVPLNPPRPNPPRPNPAD